MVLWKMQLLWVLLILLLLANGTVKVIVAGTIDLSGLDAGDLYFLSPTTAGAITLTPPSGSGQAVTRVGEAATTTKLCYSYRSSSSLKYNGRRN